MCIHLYWVLCCWFFYPAKQLTGNISCSVLRLSRNACRAATTLWLWKNSTVWLTCGSKEAETRPMRYHCGTWVTYSQSELCSVLANINVKALFLFNRQSRKWMCCTFSCRTFCMKFCISRRKSANVWSSSKHEMHFSVKYSQFRYYSYLHLLDFILIVHVLRNMTYYIINIFVVVSGQSMRK